MTTTLESYIPSAVDEGPHLILSLNSLFGSLCEPLGTCEPKRLQISEPLRKGG